MEDAQDVQDVPGAHSSKVEQESGYNAVLFPFVAILAGTITLQVFSRFSIQQSHTVAVMAEGFAFSYLLDAASSYRWARTMVHSTNAWAHIEGNLILFAFLPALLFGDAMALNIHSFKACLLQSIILAGPGVVVGALIMGGASFFFLPFGWDLSLCMVFGSILSATDPVAALTMLKALGADRIMSAQITGEALLNDGTSMVLFQLFWTSNEVSTRLSGKLTSLSGTLTVLGSVVRIVFGAPLVGLVLGSIAYAWLCSASDKYSERNVTVQLAITICLAYLSYFMGEELGVSGVVTCVSAALYLAQYAWPVISSRESTERVWHALVYFMNTLIFFLAGVITQQSIEISVDRRGTSLIVFVAIFWVVMTFARAAVVLLALPVLNKVGPPISSREAGFMVWAGLRGAVGLALALVVLQDGKDKQAGEQVLAMVAGLAFLSIIIQGSTFGALLQWWHMLDSPPETADMMHSVTAYIEEASRDEFARRRIAYAATDVDQSNQSINDDARDAVHYLSCLRQDSEFSVEEAAPLHRRQQGPTGQVTHLGVFVEQSDVYDGQLLTLDKLERLVHDGTAEVTAEQLMSMRELHYRVVSAEYWRQLKHGHLSRTSRAPAILLNSVEAASWKLDRVIWDFRIILDDLENGWASRVWRIYNSMLLQVGKFLPVAWASIPRRAYYLRTFTNSEMLYHLTASYASAHEVAQRKVGLLFGRPPENRRPEYIAVALESARCVAEARKVYASIHYDVVRLIKMNLAASSICDIGRDMLFRLEDEGVLSRKDSNRIAQNLKKDSRLLTRARSQRANSLASALGYLDGVGSGGSSGYDTDSDGNASSRGRSSSFGAASSQESWARYGSTTIQSRDFNGLDDESSGERGDDNSVLSIARRLRKAAAKVTGFHGFFTTSTSSLSPLS